MYGLLNSKKITQQLNQIKVTSQILNSVCETTVTQKYLIEAPSNLEVYYKFPVPANNSVTDFTIDIGETSIKGVLLEKETAIDTYDKAIQEGNSAFLLQKCDNDSLECCLGNVSPGTEITITIKMCCVLSCEINCNTFRVIIPTTIAQKYDPGFDTNQDIVHGKTTYTADYHFNIKMIGGIKSIRCNETFYNPESENFSFSVCPEALNKDIVVLIERCVSSCHAISNNNLELGDNLFKYATQINIIPEVDSIVRKAENIHYSLLLDCSGSMQGDMNVLKESAKTAINIFPQGNSIKDLSLVSFCASFNQKITDVSFMQSLKKLKAGGNCGITQKCIDKLNLTTLDVTYNRHVFDVSFMKNLKNLNASLCSPINDKGIEGLSLKTLNASRNKNITNVSAMTSLKILNATRSGITQKILINCL